MKLRWTRLALADFLDAQEYIAQDSPLAAQAVAQRIDEAARGLLDHPQIGRPGHVEGTRERVVMLRAADTYLVLGVAPGQVRTLHVLDAPPQNFREVLAEHDENPA